MNSDPIDKANTFEMIKDLIESVSTITGRNVSETVGEQLYAVVEKKTRTQQKTYEVNELFAALAKAQSEMSVAGLNNTNPYFKTKYADLADIVRASRPALTKNGLCVIQQLQPNDDGQMLLHTILGHSSGQYIETRVRILPAKNDIQSIASYITYMRRYSYAALIGVVTGDEDDDGEIAMVSARDIVAKGPSLNNSYNPKEQSSDVITREQLEELEYELADYSDLAEEVMEKMRIQSLADLPKSKYMPALTRIREIKSARAGR